MIMIQLLLVIIIISFPKLVIKTDPQKYHTKYTNNIHTNIVYRTEFNSRTVFIS